MVGHNGEAQLTREQRLNLEMHQSAEEHFEQNTVMQQTQALTMDEQRQTLQQQPKDYYQLTDEQLVGHEIKLTAAKERVKCCRRRQRPAPRNWGYLRHFR